MIFTLLLSYLFAFSAFLSHRKHLLFSLLTLEAMILSLLTPIMYYSAVSFNSYILIAIFVLAVVEASLGLSILVSLSRLGDNSLVNA